MKNRLKMAMAAAEILYSEERGGRKCGRTRDSERKPKRGREETTEREKIQ